MDITLAYKMPVTASAAGALIFETAAHPIGDATVMQITLQANHVSTGAQINVQMQQSIDGDGYVSLGSAISATTTTPVPLVIPVTTALQRYFRAQITLPNASTHVVFTLLVRLLQT